MPGTASNRNTDRARSRTRPSSVARGAKTNTPILFRLPTVQFPEAAPVTEDALLAMDDASVVAAPPILTAQVAETQAPAAQAVADVETDRAEAPAGDLQRSWWEHWSSGVVLILLVIALVTASIIAFNDTPPAQADSLAGAQSSAIDDFDLESMQIPNIDPGHVVSPTAVGAMTPQRETPPSISSSKTELTVKPAASPTVAEPVAQAVPTKQVENDAKVVASPIKTESVLPTKDLEFANDLLETTPTGVAVADSSPANLSPATPAAATPPPATASQSDAAQAVASESLILDELEFTELTEPGPKASQEVATAAGNGSNNTAAANAAQAPLELETPTATTSPTLTSAALQPLATLSSPIGVPGPALPSRSAAMNPFPSAPAGAPAMATTVANDANSSVPVGASPEFYDGAAKSAPMETTVAGRSELPTASQAGVMRSTNLPELSGLLTASPTGTTQYSTAAHQQNATSAAANGTTASGTAAAAAPGVVSSQTPELDTDAMARAYLRFQQMNRAQNDQLSNRYQAAAGAAQPAAAMPTQPAAAGSTGFTLGAPRQANPAIPPAGSYR